jgi:8-oxo-dGTP diphosphatase
MPDSVQSGRQVREATSIAIAVVEHEGHVLIGQRPVGVPLAGYWEFPGGKVIAGETAQDAAIRECVEETGIEITVDDLADECWHEYDHGRLHLQFFSCQPHGKPAPPRPPFRWVKRDDLAQYEFPPGNAGLLKLLLDRRGTPQT